METKKQEIKSFLTKHIKNREIEDSDDIFKMGLVNSMFAMQLVLFVEQNFGISVDNDDLDLDNFRTIDAIAGLVERKSA